MLVSQQELFTMTDNLILDSLEISNFRAFKHLQIDRLSRVNLIVGQNNIGKTCLLEALLLYANYGNPRIIEQILRDRGEEIRYDDDENRPDYDSVIEYLFYGYETAKEKISRTITIGSTNNKLRVRVQDIDRAIIEAVNHFPNEKWQENQNTRSEIKKILFSLSENGYSPDLGKKILTCYNQVYPYRRKFDYIDKSCFLITTINTVWISDTILHEWSRNPYPDEISHQFMPTSGIEEGDLRELWDNVYLTDLEETVTDALRIIEPNIERIGCNRYPMAKLPQSKTPIMLSSLGEGMNRIFELALILVNLENGILLIDEIENGLYYGIQPKVWSFIFKMAERLNVQVFATTHSWDMIRAFQKALHERDKDDGLLISLRPKVNKPGEVVGFISNEEELDIAVEAAIEVR